MKGALLPRCLAWTTVCIVLLLMGLGCSKTEQPPPQSQAPPASAAPEPAQVAQPASPPQDASPAPAVPVPSKESAPAKPPAVKAPAPAASPLPAPTPAPSETSSASPAPPVTAPSQAPASPPAAQPAAAPVPQASAHAAVGSDKCKMCHRVQYESWAVSKHAAADPPVACETCHGNGGDYVTMSVMKDASKAKAAGLILPGKEFCTAKCHKAEAFGSDMLQKAHAHRVK